jgi:hypothetical protein
MRLFASMSHRFVPFRTVYRPFIARFAAVFDPFFIRFCPFIFSLTERRIFGAPTCSSR